MYICKATGSQHSQCLHQYLLVGWGSKNHPCRSLLPSQSDVIKETYCLQITLASTGSCSILKRVKNNTAVAKTEAKFIQCLAKCSTPLLLCLLRELDLVEVESTSQFRLPWLLSPLIRFSCCSAKACHFCLFFLQPSSKGEQASDTCVRA